jgi:hypothetical protein
VNQYYWPAGAFDYKVQACFVNGYKLGFGVGIVMGDAGRDESLLESAGDAHHEVFSLRDAKG